MTDPAARTLAFDDVVVDLDGRRLWRAGAEQALEPKAFDVLQLLIHSPGRVFTRDEILDAVWGHRHVTPSVLNRIASLLRQALGEAADRPRRLHTVHGVGYRFDLPASPAVPPPATQPQSAPVPPRGLSWRWPAAAMLLALAFVVWQLLRQDATTGDSASSPRASLAVLPFTDLSPAHDQAHFAEGLAEQILGQLAQAPALRVVGRTSSFSYSGDSPDLQGIGQQLQVTHLLRGSLRRDDTQLRVTAQLLRAGDGTHLWSKTYTRTLADVFAVQDEIAREVAQALSVRLDVAQFNRKQGGTTHVEAYDRLLRWRRILMQEQFDAAHDRERLLLAREMVALDPQCVLCRDALATSLHAVAAEIGGEQADLLRAEASEMRSEIGRIAPQSWLARRDRANALWRGGQRTEAIALARQVATSGPLNKERAWDYAYMLYAMGHLGATVKLVEQVRALEPRALFLSRDLQYDYAAARRFADAEAEYQRGLGMEGSQLDPDYLAFIRQLAGRRGDDRSALRRLHARLLRQDTDFSTPFFADLGTALDDRNAMLAMVRRALDDARYGGGDVFAYQWTQVADALGDSALAVAALRRDLERQPGFSTGTMAQQSYVAFWNAPYSGLRAHPQFKELLVAAGVAGYWRSTGNWGDGCRPAGTDDFECQ